jgi:peptidoglycan/LPS O-acetylase OafA/YrhL
METIKPGHRYAQLDSLRGIASLQVMNHHILLMAPVIFAYDINFRHSEILKEKLAFILTFSPLHFIWQGPEAVLFFFVLSGFVLSSALKGGFTIRKYNQYLIKRFFRLYVPFIAVILLSMIMRAIVFNDTDTSLLSSWFNGMWNHQVSTKEFFDLIFFKFRDVHNIVTTLWSIEVEIKISVLIPLILLILNFFQKHTWLNLLLNIACLVIALLVTQNTRTHGVNDPTLVYDEIILRSTFPFIAGIFLFKYHETLIRPFINMPRALLIIIFLITLMFYNVDWLAWTLSGTAINQYLSFIFGNNDEVKVICSCLFIIISFNKYAQNILLKKQLIWLGKISFSLYLVHPIMIMSFGRLLIPFLHILIIQFIVAIASLVFAYIIYIALELPSNNLGRRLSAKLELTKKLPQKEV